MSFISSMSHSRCHKYLIAYKAQQDYGVVDERIKKFRKRVAGMVEN